jgi:hypothetical protein
MSKYEKFDVFLMVVSAVALLSYFFHHSKGLVLVAIFVTVASHEWLVVRGHIVGGKNDLAN